jgi:hypothetical protein
MKLSTTEQRMRHYLPRISKFVSFLQDQLADGSIPGEGSREATDLAEVLRKAMKEIPSLATHPDIVSARALVSKLRRGGYLLPSPRPYSGGLPSLGKRR